MLNKAMSPPDCGGYLNMSEIINISNFLADLYELPHASLKQIEHNITVIGLENLYYLLLT
jgi:hypothetical protein